MWLRPDQGGVAAWLHWLSIWLLLSTRVLISGFWVQACLMLGLKEKKKEKKLLTSVAQENAFHTGIWEVMTNARPPKAPDSRAAHGRACRLHKFRDHLRHLFVFGIKPRRRANFSSCLGYVSLIPKTGGLRARGRSAARFSGQIEWHESALVDTDRQLSHMLVPGGLPPLTLPPPQAWASILLWFSIHSQEDSVAVFFPPIILH